MSTYSGAPRIVVSKLQWEQSQKALENTLGVTFNNPYLVETKTHTNGPLL